MYGVLADQSTAVTCVTPPTMAVIRKIKAVNLLTPLGWYRLNGVKVSLIDTLDLFSGRRGLLVAKDLSHVGIW